MTCKQNYKIFYIPLNVSTTRVYILLPYKFLALILPQSSAQEIDNMKQMKNFIRTWNKWKSGPQTAPNL
jgi:hypothetical protein